MIGHHYRYNPPTSYRPWAFVGYYAFHPITGMVACLSWLVVEDNSRDL